MSKEKRYNYYNEDYYKTKNPKDIDPYFAYMILNHILNTSQKEQFKILDVGCGLGALVNFLNECGFKAYGIDVSSFAAKASKQIRASSTHLPFKDHSLDTVVSIHQIEHLTEKEINNFLDECYRVLKPSGKLFLLTPNLWSILRILRKKNWFADPTHISLFNPKNLRGIVYKHNFSDINFRFKIPLLLQCHKNNKWIAPLYGLELLTRKVPLIQDIFFYIFTVTPFAYFREVIYMSAIKDVQQEGNKYAHWN